MIQRNIIIYEFNSLYQILNEINDYLMFNIMNQNQENIEEANLNNAIILAKFQSKDFLLKNKKMDQSKVIFFLDENEKLKDLNNNQTIYCPFNIYDLLEKINISLIKKKYSDQSNIIISDYILNLNSRVISKNNISLKLTEKEIEIIIFLKNNSKPQKVSVLQNKVWGYSLEMETHTVETHIYRLRKKITETFKDNNFIISNESGYLIK
tara:strand:- start:493 stop:1119 length:627 start_codon:yes stop_codon:yes gene_type:complete